MKYKYGEFSENQINEIKKYMQKQVFYLILYVDPSTKDKYSNVDLDRAFDGIQTEFAGLNEILFYPVELVRVCSFLESAWKELHNNTYTTDNFRESKYRKLILDAGSEIMKIKEV